MNEILDLRSPAEVLEGVRVQDGRQTPSNDFLNAPVQVRATAANRTATDIYINI